MIKELLELPIIEVLNENNNFKQSNHSSGNKEKEEKLKNEKSVM